MSIIARRDTQALLEVVHKDIQNSFGPDAGIDEFKKIWSIDRPESRLWEELAKVLALGGSSDRDGQFTAPYTFTRWPQEVDSFGHVAIVGASVRVRLSPSKSAESLASLSFSIVEQVESELADANWVAVRLPKGKVGYIDKRYVRSPIDYRAVFEKERGRWQLKMFLAGD